MSKPGVAITTNQAQAPLSQAQKRFNTLIKKIETQRALLLAWQEALVPFRRRRAAEFFPLLAAYRTECAEFVRFLDRRCDQTGISRAQRDTLRQVICSLAGPLVDSDDGLEMKAIFNRNSEVDFDELGEAQDHTLRAMVEDLFGADPSEAAAPQEPPPLPRRKPRGQPSKQVQEAAEAGRSLREVFRKLASALHPDRETDAAERERKTALMQRVNQAYENHDLLSLLELQLQVEQIDPFSLHAIADDRLKHYNKILAEQHEELQQEVRDIEDGMAVELGADPFKRLAPARLMSLHHAQKQALEFDLLRLKNDRRRLVDDQQLKRWIKQQRAAVREEEESFFGGDGLF